MFHNAIDRFCSDWLKPTKKSEDENSALATPLSYTGTPGELDQELGKHIASYVETHQQLGSTLAQAKAEMDAAAKAAQEEAKRKAAERSKKAADSKPAATTSQPATPPPDAPMTLFPAAETTATAANSGGGM
jgi:PRTRC genetic system protein E